MVSNKKIPILLVLTMMLNFTACVRSMTYPAPDYPVPEKAPHPFESVSLALSDGNSLSAWYLEAGEQEMPRPTVIFFHGNGENLETMRLSGTFFSFHSLGFHVIALDYPGYGNSTGIPSEASLIAAADSVVAWAAQHMPPGPKIVCGWSLGAAVAVQAASRQQDKVSGLILLSPWSSLEDFAAAHYTRFLARLLLSDKYLSARAAKNVTCPSLVLHGQEDHIIPAKQGREVANNLSGLLKSVFVPNTAHNDLLEHKTVWREMFHFIKGLEHSQ